MPEIDKSPQRVRQMFREISSKYDLMNHVLSAGIDYRWRAKTVNRLRIEGKMPVLDVCTGTGDLALAMAQRLPEPVPIVGADFCREMLEIAGRKDRKQRVQFVEGDAVDLPFLDGTFQAVTVAFGLRNVSNLDQGLKELARVCSPGGQILILDFSKPQMMGVRQGYDFYFRHILPRIGHWMTRNGDAYAYLPNSVEEFPMGSGLVERMRNAGMRQVRFTPLTFGIATLYEGQR
jgi:demethylmenaquinone methyltransferase/2-methoxy-6-polyprenyl-1,4-benzoquinol methylase